MLGCLSIPVVKVVTKNAKEVSLVWGATNECVEKSRSTLSSLEAKACCLKAMTSSNEVINIVPVSINGGSNLVTDSRETGTVMGW